MVPIIRKRRRARELLGKWAIREETVVFRRYCSAALQRVSGSDSSKGQQKLCIFINVGFTLTMAADVGYSFAGYAKQQL